jgi:hypothetical protein
MVYTIGFERRLAGGGAPIRANFSASEKFCECSKISTTKEIQIMAIGVYFGFTGLDAAKYAECLKRLKKAGAGHPAGRSYHVSFGPTDKLMVFDVWSSQAAFDRFGKTLMPIMQQLGAAPEPPTVMAIHRVITPPAAEAKKRTLTKRTAGRRKGKKK